LTIFYVFLWISIKFCTTDIHQNLLSDFKLRENRQGSWSPQRLKKKAAGSTEKWGTSKLASQRNRHKDQNAQYQRCGIPFCCDFYVSFFRII